MNTCTILLLQFYGCLCFYGESDCWKKKKYGCNFFILLAPLAISRYKNYINLITVHPTPFCSKGKHHSKGYLLF